MKGDEPPKKLPCSICGKTISWAYLPKHLETQHPGGVLKKTKGTVIITEEELRLGKRSSSGSVPDVSDDLLLSLMTQEESVELNQSNPEKKNPEPKESEIQRKLERKYKAHHHSCPAGEIDIFVPGVDLIEIKKWSDWKHALGQILAYSFFYPKMGRKIHFFGKSPSTELKLVIMAVLTHYGVQITFEKSE